MKVLALCHDRSSGADARQRIIRQYRALCGGVRPI